MTPTVTSLVVYPLKGARGITVDSLTFDARGPVGDRRWMLVDEAGFAITPRGVTRLVLLQQSFSTHNRDGAIRLAMEGVGSCELMVPSRAVVRNVGIWDDTIPAYDAGDDVAAWCTMALGTPCRAVRIADEARRPLQQRFSGSLSADGRETTLSDGAPLLVLSEQSVAALNARLAAQSARPLAIDRFRPNIIVATAQAHDEDSWRDVRIGDVTISVGAPCKRCVVTTINPRTAEKGVEPLRTLAAYRQVEQHVMFGMNATHAISHADATVRVGDAVHVLSYRGPTVDKPR